MLPRRCKKCRCYVAPQLARCPRCGLRAPVIATSKVTKEEKRAARAKKDAKVPVIHAKHIHWVPSAFAVRAQSQMVEELQRRLERTEVPRLRNAIRSELRLVRATLARITVPSGKKPWTTEHLHTKQQCITVFISPKGHRYVMADKDGAADLIVANRKRDSVAPFTRLARFEKTRFARAVKKERQDETIHKKRRAVKRKARAECRARKRAPSQ